MDQPSLAYALRRQGAGWSWRITNAAGDTVATGLEQARAAAVEAIDGSLRALARAGVGELFTRRTR
ncbi:hypothetical protein [Phenylobacterium sp.]|uniref:hypothetical protein n=1 Tax=Phenylobacterium sp. TaxID=1871053 RepID=UPI002734A5DC|nr:hypothetical protein [Phenylobacterium sp.]MDP3659103.1 hypothetical protein [Phenylobacterium sp.]